MANRRNSHDEPAITTITSTLCRLMGVELPRLAREAALEPVIEIAHHKGISQIRRCLVYAPDAVGRRLVSDRWDLVREVTRFAPLHLPVVSVFPPKTPVCFASMFTGAPPAGHGLTRYEKPVLRCDTLFDAFARTGKRVAIAAVEDSSLDLIFRGRSIDYLSEPDDDRVTCRSLELIEGGRHDLIVAYHQEYDDVMHETHPTSPRAIRALRHHIDSFCKMAHAAWTSWDGTDSLVLFAPDHGAHRDPITGKGTHGENIPDDMEIMHFFGVAKG